MTPYFFREFRKGPSWVFTGDRAVAPLQEGDGHSAKLLPLPPRFFLWRLGTLQAGAEASEPGVWDLHQPFHGEDHTVAVETSFQKMVMWDKLGSRP